MRERLVWSAPFVASLLGHLALIALVSGAALLFGPAAPPEENFTPLRSVAASSTAPAKRLLLETAGRAELQPPPQPSEDGAVALDTEDPRYRPYLDSVKRRIWERWNAPALPEGREARGVLVVEFTLTRSGRLAASGVRETSGVPALDRAALDAVAQAVPFKPLPPSIAGASMSVRARFVYD